jgi:phosphomevalonate kinase
LTTNGCAWSNLGGVLTAGEVVVIGGARNGGQEASVQRRRIEGNHDAVVMQRLARQHEEAHVRDQRGVATAECKERHALEIEEQRQLKTLMVIVHTERSHLRRAMRHDASHRKVFNRWTRKAGAIAEWVADSDCLSSAKAATLMSARGAPSSGAYEQ